MRTKKAQKKNNQTGQVMLLTTLVIAGTLLAAVTIAGILMVYQVRQSGNAAQSGKAIFAADSGIEYELYRIYQDCNYPAPVFSNGAALDSQAKREGNDVVITATGNAGKTNRAFRLNLGPLIPGTLCGETARGS